MAMLIDTDVLIRFTRGHIGAQSCLALIQPWTISAVTYLELVQGCRNKDELKKLKQGLERRNTIILPLTPAISECAAGLIETYALSDGLRLADALIASTAINHDILFLTANSKHFLNIQELNMERFLP